MNPVAFDTPPLIMHIVHAFGVGGLENGVVNLIDNLPSHRYRHVVVALTGITDFRNRIQSTGVEFVALGKRPGHGARLYPSIYRLMRSRRPAIVHTRNLAALEMMVPAWMAGVPARIHGEHGRDVGDFDGSSARHRWIRRAYRPFVHRYVALSRDLERYLVDRVVIPKTRVTRISNGVDIHRFSPLERRGAVPGGPFNEDGLFVFGSVGRMAEVKDPLLLARAFISLRQRETSASHARLVMVGDGPLRTVVREEIVKAGLEADVWMPGSRDDVPALLRGLDCFVLPSLAEGISNTILEAMASGLPVIATSVGGNGELVQDGVTGRLVPAANVDALVAAMKSMICDPAAARSSGVAGRARAVAQFGIESMVRRYSLLYDEMLLTPGARTRPAVSPQRAGGE